MSQHPFQVDHWYNNPSIWNGRMILRRLLQEWRRQLSIEVFISVIEFKFTFFQMQIKDLKYMFFKFKKISTVANNQEEDIKSY